MLPHRNQTNLALKGILGIEAMAQIANRTGHSAAGANYSSIAHDYITKWQTLGFALDAKPPHATLSYGQNSTWGLLYNLFMDKELGLGLVPQSVYDIQDAWYPTVFGKYGVVSLLLSNLNAAFFLSFFLFLESWILLTIIFFFNQPLDTRHSYTKSKSNHSLSRHQPK